MSEKMDMISTFNEIIKIARRYCDNAIVIQYCLCMTDEEITNALELNSYAEFRKMMHKNSPDTIIHDGSMLRELLINHITSNNLNLDEVSESRYETILRKLEDCLENDSSENILCISYLIKNSKQLLLNVNDPIRFSFVVNTMFEDITKKKYSEEFGNVLEYQAKEFCNDIQRYIKRPEVMATLSSIGRYYSMESYENLRLEYCNNEIKIAFYEPGGVKGKIGHYIKLLFQNVQGYYCEICDRIRNQSVSIENSRSRVQIAGGAVIRTFNGKVAHCDKGKRHLDLKIQQIDDIIDYLVKWGYTEISNEEMDKLVEEVKVNNE